tara:strand:- start:859 stop:1092 length:234 start_codon:yes stop_codon:yes gene_type:complete
MKQRIKDIAKDLVDGFLQVQDSYNEFPKGSMVLTEAEAVQAALICVDKILEALESNTWHNRHLLFLYVKVKNHLKKL